MNQRKIGIAEESTVSSGWGSKISAIVHLDGEWNSAANEVVKTLIGDPSKPHSVAEIVAQPIVYVYKRSGGNNVPFHSYFEDAVSIFAEKVLKNGYLKNQDFQFYEHRTRQFAKFAALEAIRFYQIKNSGLLIGEPGDFPESEALDDELEAQIEKRMAYEFCMNKLSKDRLEIWIHFKDGKNSLAEVGRMFRRDRSSIHKTIKVIANILQRCLEGRVGKNG